MRTKQPERPCMPAKHTISARQAARQNLRRHRSNTPRHKRNLFSLADLNKRRAETGAEYQMRAEITEGTTQNTAVASVTTGISDGQKGIRRIELPISGLTCANCVQAVERALKGVRGVKQATLNLAQGRAFIEYD